VFTVGNLVLGAIAALVVGLSKTAFPGAALVATPIIATIVSGRLIPGTTLPILLAADVFAVTWFSRHARWDLLRPMVVSVSIGFAAGAATGYLVGKGAGSKAGGVLDSLIGGVGGVVATVLPRLLGLS